MHHLTCPNSEARGQSAESFFWSLGKKPSTQDLQNGSASLCLHKSWSYEATCFFALTFWIAEAQASKKDHGWLFLSWWSHHQNFGDTGDLHNHCLKLPISTALNLKGITMLGFMSTHPTWKTESFRCGHDKFLLQLPLTSPKFKVPGGGFPWTWHAIVKLHGLKWAQEGSSLRMAWLGCLVKVGELEKNGR